MFCSRGIPQNSPLISRGYIEGASVYMDDIIVWGTTEAEHDTSQDSIAKSLGGGAVVEL